MHGTGLDDCNYTPAKSNVTLAWDKTYVSGDKTNATYALSQKKDCNEHQDNAMDCSFSPLIQGRATQAGRDDPKASVAASLAQKDPNCTMHGTGLDDCNYNPAKSNVTLAWDKTYVSGDKTNATYALS
jgi:hypothetical protein